MANVAASLPPERQVELAGKEEIRIADVRERSVSESDTETESLSNYGTMKKLVRKKSFCGS